MSKKARRAHPELIGGSPGEKRVSKKARQVRTELVEGSPRNKPKNKGRQAHRELLAGAHQNSPAMVFQWGGLLQSYETGPTPESKAIEAAIEDTVAAFGLHKDNLLGVLLNAWERGPKPQAFDKEKAWDRLSRLAWHYFWVERVKQERRPARDRAKRLQKIANVLNKASRLFDDAKQDTLIDYLYSAWCDLIVRGGAAPQCVTESDMIVHMRDVSYAAPKGTGHVRLRDEFVKLLGALIALEAATLRALKDTPSTKPGPVRVLPLEFIVLLADEYLSLCGRPPGAGQGPFYRFVMHFRAAIDDSYNTKDETGNERVDGSLIEDIKEAVRFWRRGRR
jgi:hypothetical protein